MMDTVRDAAVVLAAVLGFGLLALVGAWIWAKAQRLPPEAPVLLHRRDRADTDALLTCPPWRKRVGGRSGQLPYDRPLDVVGAGGDLPDEGLLPPPRRVAGRNGET